MAKLKLNITGMTCVNCSGSIERVASKMQGVKSAKVSFASASGEFEIDDEKTKLELIQKIKKLGYDVAKNSDDYEQKRKIQTANLQKKFIIAAVLSAVIMAFEMSGLREWKYAKICALTLGAVVLIYGASGFYKQAIEGIKERSYGMSVLVSIGASAAFIYSAFSLFLPNLMPQNMAHSYIGGASMIITFVLLGKYLEERSKASTVDFLHALSNLVPKISTRIRDDGLSEFTSVENLKIADVVAVKSGEVIPSDGIILKGGAEIDTSAITGEILAKYKTVGDEVHAGYINTNGFIHIKVTALAQDTLLNQIAEILTQASTKRTSMARLADKASNYFVPTVIAICIITLLIWGIAGNINYAILCAISVLIISCPCALGLATPIAVIASISRAARDGILIKNPETIEYMQKIKFAVFDKTGTLTKGEISVKKADISDDDLSIIAAAESLSEHPISKAITKYANEKKVAFSDLGEIEFKSIVGKGIIINQEKGKIIVGNKTLLKENNIAIKDDTKDGVHAAIYGRYVGSFELEDKIRQNAKSAIKSLQNMGIKTIIMTGDSSENAQKVADELGIDNTMANMLPIDKLNHVKQLKQSGRVMFIGDGINDTISLKEADVAIAMGAGSDLAKNSTDIVLVNSDLSSIPKAIKIGKSGLSVIRQNLFWAFAYNAVCIPIAAGMLYPIFGIVLNPAYGALAMCFSSISVILNSLRIKRIKSI